MFLKRREGFSLIEAMVAVVVLGIGLVSLLHTFQTGLRISRITKDTTIATLLAQRAIESMRIVLYNQIPNDSGRQDIPEEKCASHGLSLLYPNFQWQRRSSEAPSTVKGESAASYPYLKKITVDVFYTPYGIERRVRLTTYLTDYKKW